METPRKDGCRKRHYQNTTFEHKLFVIAQINNGQISANFASKKYDISRSTIHYWMKKLSNYTQQKPLSLKMMRLKSSKNDWKTLY